MLHWWPFERAPWKLKATPYRGAITVLKVTPAIPDTGPSEAWGAGGQVPFQFLTDQLTLSQLGEQIMPTRIFRPSYSPAMMVVVQWNGFEKSRIDFSVHAKSVFIPTLLCVPRKVISHGEFVSLLHVFVCLFCLFASVRDYCPYWDLSSV